MLAGQGELTPATRGQGLRHMLPGMLMMQPGAVDAVHISRPMLLGMLMMQSALQANEC